MKDLSALWERFSARELEVRRLYARDDDFRNACDDYEEAITALRLWECHRNNAERAAEYRELSEDIAAEIAERLDAASA